MNRARNNGRVGGTTDNNRMNNGMNVNPRTNGDMNGGANGNTRMNGNTGGNMYGNMNGGMNGNMNQGNRTGVGGRALTGDLIDQIRALRFVKTELELYLDTHPGCRTALDYYYQTLAELKRLTEEYENTVGPLTAAGVTDTENWTWVGGPWPWQQAGDFMREGDR